MDAQTEKDCKETFIRSIIGDIFTHEIAKKHYVHILSSALLLIEERIRQDAEWEELHKRAENIHLAPPYLEGTKEELK